MSLTIHPFFMVVCASGKLHGFQAIAHRTYLGAEGARKRADNHPDGCGPHLVFGFGGEHEPTEDCGAEFHDDWTCGLMRGHTGNHGGLSDERCEKLGIPLGNA